MVEDDEDKVDDDDDYNVQHIRNAAASAVLRAVAPPAHECYSLAQ